jgi:hypothetical protein
MFCYIVIVHYKKRLPFLSFLCSSRLLVIFQLMFIDVKTNVHNLCSSVRLGPEECKGLCALV